MSPEHAEPELAAQLVRFTGRMLNVCMYCKDAYGQIPCAPEQDGKKSHGVCHSAECRARWAADMEMTPEEMALFFGQEGRENPVRQAQGGGAGKAPENQGGS